MSGTTQSALDRVSVLPLITAIKRQLKQSLEAVVFASNDALTRGTLANVVEGYLSDIRVRRGVADYKVVCNASNNPATSDELCIDVFIKPQHAIEYITIQAKVASGPSIHDNYVEAPDVTEDLGHQLEAWTAARGGSLHWARNAVGQPVPLGPGWQPSDGDREVPSVA